MASRVLRNCFTCRRRASPDQVRQRGRMVEQREVCLCFFDGPRWTGTECQLLSRREFEIQL